MPFSYCHVLWLNLFYFGGGFFVVVFPLAVAHCEMVILGRLYLYELEQF